MSGDPRRDRAASTGPVPWQSPDDTPAATPVAPRAASATPSDRRSVASDDLFQGRRELVIVHGHDEYHLRITRAGKLILTK